MYKIYIIINNLIHIIYKYCVNLDTYLFNIIEWKRKGIYGCK